MLPAIGRFLLNVLTVPDLMLFVWYTSLPKAKKHIGKKRVEIKQKGKREMKTHDINANNIFQRVMKDVGRYQDETPLYLRIIPTILITLLILI